MQPVLIAVEKSEAARLGHEGNVVGAVDLLRSLAIAERYDDLAEAVLVFSERCEPLTDFSKAYLCSQLPALIIHDCCRRLGRDFARRFIAWSSSPDNADWERRMAKSVMSGSALREEVRRTVEAIKRFELPPRRRG